MRKWKRPKTQVWSGIRNTTKHKLDSFDQLVNKQLLFIHTMAFTSLVVLENVLEESSFIFSSRNELFLITFHLVVSVLLLLLVIVLSSICVLGHASEDGAEAGGAGLHKKHNRHTNQHYDQTGNWDRFLRRDKVDWLVTKSEEVIDQSRDNRWSVCDLVHHLRVSRVGVHTVEPLDND